MSVFGGARDLDLVDELPTRRARRRAARTAILAALALGVATAAVFAAAWALLDLVIERRGLTLGEAEAIVTFAAGVAFGAWLNREIF